MGGVWGWGRQMVSPDQLQALSNNGVYGVTLRLEVVGMYSSIMPFEGPVLLVNTNRAPEIECLDFGSEKLVAVPFEL